MGLVGHTILNVGLIDRKSLGLQKLIGAWLLSCNAWKLRCFTTDRYACCHIRYGLSTAKSKFWFLFDSKPEGRFQYPSKWCGSVLHIWQIRSEILTICRWQWGDFVLLKMNSPSVSYVTPRETYYFLYDFFLFWIFAACTGLHQYTTGNEFAKICNSPRSPLITWRVVMVMLPWIPSTTKDELNSGFVPTVWPSHLSVWISFEGIHRWPQTPTNHISFITYAPYAPIPAGARCVVCSCSALFHILAHHRVYI